MAAITCVRAVLKSSSSSILLSLAPDWLTTLLTGHSDGKVCIWTVDYDNMAIRSERILCFYNAFVTDIVVTSIGYAICTNDMGVHVWDLDMTNSVKEVDLNTLGLRLNAKLKNVVPSENKLFFLTLESEMFSVDLFISPAWSKNMFVYKYEIQAIDLLVRKVLPDGGAALRMMFKVLREELDDGGAPEKAVLGRLAHLETTTDSLIKAAGTAPQLPYWVAGDYLRAVALVLLGWAWVRICKTPGAQVSERWQAPNEAMQRWVMPEFDMRMGVIENEIRRQD